MSPSAFPVARRIALALALVLVLPVSLSTADARAGGGSSFGSRGSRTFSAPPATTTAPRYSQPFQRSETPNASAAPSRGFGFGGGLLAGLLGAGLVGSLFGGGMLGIASLFGLLFKVALIGGLIWLVLRLVRGRSSGAALAGGASSFTRTGLGSSLPGGAPPARGTPVTLDPQDFAAFESTLTAVQEAYSREDVNGLATMATPEMVRDLQSELGANRQRGLRNDVSQTRLVQGDLSEAWREGQSVYATVAMRFSAIDVMVERATGKISSGDPVHPVEATELWTFRRDGGSRWGLAAIQQAG